jgi:acetyltransferase
MFSGLLSLLTPRRAVVSSPALPFVDSARLQLTWSTAEGTELQLRRVHAEDASLLGELLDAQLSARSRYCRFHGAVGRLSAQRLDWLANADFQRHAAYVVTQHEGRQEHAVAEGRWVRSGSGGSAEFAMCVADGWQRQGIGRRLLCALVMAARQRQVDTLVGDVLPGNLAMQALASSQHFNCGLGPEGDGALRMTLNLDQPATPQRAARPWLH